MVLKAIFVMLVYSVKIRSDDMETTSSKPTTKHSIGGGGNSNSKPLAWGYLNGTEDWCNIFEKCCGKSQSPINIDAASTTLKSIPHFEFNDYYKEPSTLTMENDGRKVILTLKYDGSRPFISGGGLDGTYTFASVHFHWGSSEETGSEHFLNDVGSPFEIQIVHVNIKYRSLVEAVGSPNGLVILGCYGEVHTKNNTKLDNVIQNLPKIKYRGQSVTLKKEEISLILGTFLPFNTGNFFRYSGSLTFPSCHESVTWTIFRNFVPLSEEQIQEFRHLHASIEGVEPVPLTANVRPIQELNDRVVYYMSNLGSLTHQYSSFFMLIAGLIISCLY